MTTEKLSRKERDRLRHRKLILDAALALFTEKGYSNVSMKEIADTAEFGTGTLYNFFKSKEDLYHEILFGFINDFLDKFRAVLDSAADPIEKLTRYLALKCGVVRENEKLVSFLFCFEYTDMRLNERVFESEINALKRDYIGMIEGVFKEGVEMGLFRQSDPLIMAELIETLTNKALHLAMNYADRFDILRTTDIVKDMVLKYIRIESGERV